MMWCLSGGPRIFCGACLSTGTMWVLGLTLGGQDWQRALYSVRHRSFLFWISLVAAIKFPISGSRVLFVCTFHNFWCFHFCLKRFFFQVSFDPFWSLFFNFHIFITFLWLFPSTYFYFYPIIV